MEGLFFRFRCRCRFRFCFLYLRDQTTSTAACFCDTFSCFPLPPLPLPPPTPPPPLLQAYSDFLEQELLDLFERAAGRSPPEVALMRECSDILFALNEGDHLQSRFVFFVVTQVRATQQNTRPSVEDTPLLLCMRVSFLSPEKVSFQAGSAVDSGVRESWDDDESTVRTRVARSVLKWFLTRIFIAQGSDYSDTCGASGSKLLGFPS